MLGPLQWHVATRVPVCMHVIVTVYACVVIVKLRNANCRGTRKETADTPKLKIKNLIA